MISSSSARTRMIRIRFQSPSAGVKTRSMLRRPGRRAVELELGEAVARYEDVARRVVADGAGRLLAEDDRVGVRGEHAVRTGSRRRGGPSPACCSPRRRRRRRAAGVSASDDFDSRSGHCQAVVRAAVARARALDDGVLDVHEPRALGDAVGRRGDRDRLRDEPVRAREEQRHAGVGAVQRARSCRRRGGPARSIGDRRGGDADVLGRRLGEARSCRWSTTIASRRRRSSSKTRSGWTCVITTPGASLSATFAEIHCDEEVACRRGSVALDELRDQAAVALRGCSRRP